MPKLSQLRRMVTLTKFEVTRTGNYSNNLDDITLLICVPNTLESDTSL